MKIYLFLNTKILTFALPKDISGSYGFDFDVNEESKLILKLEILNGLCILRWILLSLMVIWC